MTLLKTVKTITNIPFAIRNTWTTIRDLSVNQSRANQHVVKSMQQILDAVATFTRNQNDFNALMTKKLNYIEATSISLSKWHDWQESFNASLLERIISEKRLVAILRDNFDSIDLNISEHDIQCNGEEVVTALSTNIDELTIQVNDLSIAINEIKKFVEHTKKETVNVVQND
jgi:hypothetical protein